MADTPDTNPGQGGVEYDPKVHAFMEPMGLVDYCFNLSHLVPDAIVEKALAAYQNPSLFKHAAAELADISARTSHSAQYAREILVKPKISSELSSLLVDFAVHQTLNVAHSEEEKVRLNDLFRKVWAGRLDPHSRCHQRRP